MTTIIVTKLICMFYICKKCINTHSKTGDKLHPIKSSHKIILCSLARPRKCLTVHQNRKKFKLMKRMQQCVKNAFFSNRNFFTFESRNLP